MCALIDYVDDSTLPDGVTIIEVDRRECKLKNISLNLSVDPRRLLFYFLNVVIRSTGDCGPLLERSRDRS